jgi:glycosyltransferase involved in cell wall biosynthesis
VRFSVITVTFNAEKYLAQTLQSVAAQERVEFEHLVWDGGSCDRTLEIASSFPHVKIIEGKDRGIADAMNLSAAYAQGEFLLYLHADDLLAHPCALLMVKRVLDLHPDVSWLYGKAHIIDQEGSYLRTTSFEPFSEKRLRKYNFITHPATIVSSALFKKVGGFHVNLRYCMDYDLWLRLARYSAPLTLATPLACFREHRDSLSTREPLQVADEAYFVRNCHLFSFYERFRSYRTWKKRRKKLCSKPLGVCLQNEIN